jgi:hypothetical protein
MKNRFHSATALHGSATLPFVIPRSRGICSSADLSWKCFSTERCEVETCPERSRTATCCFFPFRTPDSPLRSPVSNLTVDQNLLHMAGVLKRVAIENHRVGILAFAQ